MLDDSELAPRAAADPDRVRELKYLLPAGRTSAMAASLAAYLRPDPEFPDNAVVSVYFDTPDLESIGEKINGDSRKRKVRLRWYEGPAGPHAPSPSFLEVKLRLGEVRWKLRAEADAAERPWRELPLEHLAWVDLPRRLAPASFRLAPGLVPTAVIRYRRRRFVDPATRCRVALDCDIRLTAWHRGLLPDVAPARLDHSVLEVKGAAEPAAHLRFLIARLGGRRSAFSKYTAALGLH